MKVSQINGYHLRFEPGEPLGNSRTFMRKREFLALELLTDGGLRGWGEVFSSPWAAAALIRAGFGHQVLGKSAQLHGRLFAEMLASTGYDRRGASMMAISALDMALHDIAARERGLSVAQMLGGALRDRVFAYASGPFLRDNQAPCAHFNSEAESYLKLGFRAIKPRAGLSPRADGQMIRSMRDAVGPDIGLMVDINQGYTVGAACTSAREMESVSLLWMEEPVQPEDVAGYQTIARSTSVPVAGGEALGSLASFRDFLAASALSVVQPDMGVCGGFSGFQRVASLCAAYDLPVMPHVFGTPINFYASLQMAALLPARRGGGPAPYPWIEYDATDNPLMKLYDFPVQADGCVPLPESPGMGFELTPDRLAPWTVESWSIEPT